jgi:hypothetical protein
MSEGRKQDNNLTMPEIEDTPEEHELTTNRYGIRRAGVFMVNIPCIPTLDCPREERNNHG